MKRREFMKMAALAMSVVGMTPMSRRDTSDLLVIQVSNDVTSSDAKDMLDELRRHGIEAIVISGAEHVAAADKESTFFSANQYRGKVVADGVELSHVVWCETSHGLVCQSVDHRERIVRRFDRVEFTARDQKNRA